jgi:hypothetical protein
LPIRASPDRSDRVTTDTIRDSIDLPGYGRVDYDYVAKAAEGWRFCSTPDPIRGVYLAFALRWRDDGWTLHEPVREFESEDLGRAQAKDDAANLPESGDWTPLLRP